MLDLFRRLLLRLPPELAHRVAIFGLRCLQWFWFDFQRKTKKGTIAIRTQGKTALVFGSRLGLAAGFDKGAEAYAGLIGLGFGFIEVGTVTPRPQEGNPTPRIWRVAPESLVNHLGFNNPGVRVFADHLARYRKRIQVPVFANIGKNRSTPNDAALEDYKICWERLLPWVDGFVVNLSSPNTPGLRDLQSEAFVEQLAAAVPAVPVLLKLSGDLEDDAIIALADQVKRTPSLSGLVLTNTSSKLAKELRGFSQGGFSGPALYDRSLECVSMARQALGPDKLLIGVGGITSAEDACDMIQHGADLVEIYTAFIYQGVRLVRRINSALS